VSSGNNVRTRADDGEARPAREVRFGTNLGENPGTGKDRDAGKRDRRVARTHSALRDALVSLTLEKGYDAVSVRDVLDRANVGRSTFYAHFANKEALLLSGFDELHRELQAKPRSERRALEFAVPVLAHVEASRRLARAVLGRRAGAAVQRRLKMLVAELVAQDLDAGLLGERYEGLPRGAVTEYLAAGFLALVIWSLDRRPPPSSDELLALFRSLAGTS
jgi:AcrR family transcriptional regulator